MQSSGLLLDGFDRISQIVGRVLNEIEPDALTYRVDPDANSVGWLIWHLTRVQDDHLADAFADEQVWTAAGWYDRFALPFDPSATGYGHTSADVALVQAPATLLLGYLRATHERTIAQLTGITDADLDRVVDTSWDPHVTLGVRLISVIADGLQHAGQAAFVRGIAGRRSGN